MSERDDLRHSLTIQRQPPACALRHDTPASTRVFLPANSSPGLCACKLPPQVSMRGSKAQRPPMNAPSTRASPAPCSFTRKLGEKRGRLLVRSPRSFRACLVCPALTLHICRSRVEIVVRQLLVSCPTLQPPPFPFPPRCFSTCCPFQNHGWCRYPPRSIV